MVINVIVFAVTLLMSGFVAVWLACPKCRPWIEAPKWQPLEWDQPNLKSRSRPSKPAPSSAAQEAADARGSDAGQGDT